MRFIRPLDEILGRRSKVALLRYLILHRSEATGRDLARSVGIDHKTCTDALRDLIRSDLVRRRGVGRAWFYQLNRSFPIIKEVLEPLFDWERGIPDRFARDLRRELGRDALSIFLFGSTAKRTDVAESDIDLLIVARDRAGLRALDQKLDLASDNLMATYSRVPQFVFMDVFEFRRKFLNGDRFLNEILRSGRLLDGLQEEELLKHGRPPPRRPRHSAR